MSVAFLSAQRSKDPSSQVGACVVNADNKIVGIGYNGMPNGCSDDELPWKRHGEDELDTKYPYGKLTGQDLLLRTAHTLIMHIFCDSNSIYVRSLCKRISVTFMHV